MILKTEKKIKLKRKKEKSGSEQDMVSDMTDKRQPAADKATVIGFFLFQKLCYMRYFDKKLEKKRKKKERKSGSEQDMNMVSDMIDKRQPTKHVQQMSDYFHFK